MMQTILHEHLNNRLDIQEAMTEKVEKILTKQPLEFFLNNPQAAFAAMAKAAMVIMNDSLVDAAKEGVRFAQKVQKRVNDDKAIIVEPGNDGTRNAD